METYPRISWNSALFCVLANSDRAGWDIGESRIYFTLKDLFPQVAFGGIPNKFEGGFGRSDHWFLITHSLLYLITKHIHSHYDHPSMNEELHSD